MGQEIKLSMDYAPRRIPLPDEYEEFPAIAVAAHHIDTNHHVNNAQYVDMARESIPEGLKIRERRADYKKAAVLGDVIIPHVSQEPDHVWTVALNNTQDDAYAVIWLRTEPEEEAGPEGEKDD